MDDEDQPKIIKVYIDSKSGVNGSKAFLLQDIVYEDRAVYEVRFCKVAWIPRVKQRFPEFLHYGRLENIGFYSI